MKKIFKNSMTKEQGKQWMKVWNSFILHPIQLLFIIPFLIFVLILKYQFIIYDLEYHILNDTKEYLYYMQGIITISLLYFSLYFNGIAFNILEKLLNKKGYSMNLSNIDGRKITEKSLQEFILKKFDYIVDIKFIAGPKISEKKFNKLMDLQKDGD